MSTRKELLGGRVRSMDDGRAAGGHVFEFELRMIRHDDRGTRAVNGERGKTPCLQQYDERREGRRCRERTAKGHGFVGIEQNDGQGSREREEAVERNPLTPLAGTRSEEKRRWDK